MTDFHYARTLTRDAGEHAASLSAWEQRYEQISAGRFEGELEEFRIGPVQIFREQANRTVLQGGLPRVDTVAVALAQTGGASGTSWYCGHRLDENQPLVIASNCEFELLAAAGMNLCAVCVDTSELLQRAARAREPELRLDRPTTFLLQPSGADPVQLKGLLESALLLAHEKPGLLEVDAVRRMLADSLADAVLGCLAGPQARAERPPTAQVRRRIVTQAREYMRTHANEPITVPELCAAVGASRRTLQYAFEDILHVSPTTYLRAMRLNRVRAELLTRPDTSVGDVAARWGFWHLSRFAADYRRLFGELPSATRLRGAPC
ncbi:MAG: helix-turn-helix domain-containing protein [Variovorax sp.]|nr:MAG: helix-turn-helix domain-containing protein [Variovorax sp.]